MDEAMAGTGTALVAASPWTLPLTLAPSAINFLRGVFGESPEEQYKRAQEENIARAIKAINAESNIQRNRETRRAQSNRRLAKQGGARRAAAMGIAGDSDVYSNADVSNIDQLLNEAIAMINENEQVNILRAQSSRESVPSYMFPNKLDYLSSALGAAGSYFAGKDLANLKMAESDNIFEILDKYSPKTGGDGDGKYRLDTSVPRTRYPGLGYSGAVK